MTSKGSIMANSLILKLKETTVGEKALIFFCLEMTHFAKA
jgi:hypothetical protein